MVVSRSSLSLLVKLSGATGKPQMKRKKRVLKPLPYLPVYNAHFLEI